jgi:hypothetical protein
MLIYHESHRPYRNLVVVSLPLVRLISVTPLLHQYSTYHEKYPVRSRDHRPLRGSNTTSLTTTKTGGCRRPKNTMAVVVGNHWNLICGSQSALRTSPNYYYRSGRHCLRRRRPNGLVSWWCGTNQFSRRRWWDAAELPAGRHWPKRSIMIQQRQSTQPPWSTSLPMAATTTASS